MTKPPKIFPFDADRFLNRLWVQLRRDLAPDQSWSFVQGEITGVDSIHVYVYLKGSFSDHTECVGEWRFNVNPSLLEEEIAIRLSQAAKEWVKQEEEEYFREKVSRKKARLQDMLRRGEIK